MEACDGDNTSYVWIACKKFIGALHQDNFAVCVSHASRGPLLMIPGFNYT